MYKPIQIISFVTILMAAVVSLLYLSIAPSSSAQRAVPVSIESALLSAEEQMAQTLALESRSLQRSAMGSHTEVFQVTRLVQFRPKQQELCADAVCYQVDIYDYDAHTTTTLIVELNSNQVLDSWQNANSQPIFNRTVATRAEDLLINNADLTAALGRPAVRNEIALMDGQHGDVAGCADGDLCLTTVFVVDSGMVWATVNMRTNAVADIWWTARSTDGADTGKIAQQAPQQAANARENYCGNTYFHSEGGWGVNYELSRSDGLHAYSITYNNQPVVDSIRLAEWHVDYTVQDDDPLRQGFIDYNTCGTPLGTGFPIGPFGEPQIVPIVVLSETVGFEIRQDYRQPRWGRTCKYRYEQRYQFFNDGRWRVVGTSLGRGCGDALLKEAIYRPVMRIDLAPSATGEQFAHWDEGNGWVDQPTEAWYGPGQTVTTTEIATNAQGYGFRIINQQRGFYIEPGKGQFDDAGTGDDGWLYVTKYKTSEGAADMSSLSGCCATTYQQGPHNFVDDEAISGENVVIWYVTDQDTTTSFGASLPDEDRPDHIADAAYCWTDFLLDENDDLVTDENDFGIPVEEFPCLSGPMFVPIQPTVVTAITLGSAQSVGMSANVLIALGSLMLVGISLSATRHYGKKTDE